MCLQYEMSAHGPFPGMFQRACKTCLQCNQKENDLCIDAIDVCLLIEVIVIISGLLQLSQMNSEKINSKKETFKTDIQKTIREKYFQGVRQNVMLSRRVNEAIDQFICNQSSHIPQVCLNEVKQIIYQGQLKPFLDLLKNDQLQLIKKEEDKRQNVWFFDCTSVTNLKFMTELCKMKIGHILAGFFHATVDAYRKFYDFYVSIALRVQRSKCQISQGSESEEEKKSKKLIEFMESPQGTQAIIALLEFWGAFIQKNDDKISIKHFVMMMKLFELFAKYSEIYSCKGTLSFILRTLIYVNQRLTKVQRIDLKTFVQAEECLQFVSLIKMRMPQIMNRYVKRRQFYPEIGQILIEFQRYNTGIFYECLLQCQNLSAYLEGLLMRSKQHYRSDEIGKYVGLNLLNYLREFKNVHQVLNLKEAINIAGILSNQLVLQDQFLYSSVRFLFSLVQGDWKHNFVKIFETMNYKKLIIVVSQKWQPERYFTYSLLVKLMEVYQLNKRIYDALLVQCDFEVVLWKQLYQQTSIAQQYVQLAQLVSKNMNFFVKNYRKTVEEMCHHCKETNIKDWDLFQKIVKEFNELTTDQKL